MSRERGTPSPEEMAEIQKQRTLSDAEIIKGGAEYVVDDNANARLEVPDGRVEMAAGEMEREKQRELEKQIREGEKNLAGLNLEHFRLARADLNNANLEGVRLYGADLEDANLSGANLKRADLRDAFLRGADLTNANLEGAIFDTSRFVQSKGTFNSTKFTIRRSEISLKETLESLGAIVVDNQ